MDTFTTQLVYFFTTERIVTLPLWGSVDLQPLIATILIFFGLTAAFRLLQAILLVQLRRWSRHTATDLDDTIIDAVSGIRASVYTVVAFYIALQPLSLPVWLDTTLTAVLLVSVVWQFIELVQRFVAYAVQRFVEQDLDGDGHVDPNAATASDMIRLMAGIALWVFGILFILSNLGIEVTSLIAGLGIGGIAVAFALQGVLADLFASFSIYFDKPFRIGDFVVLGSDAGTVEKIGIKSTRIRTLQGEELVVSNAELTTTRVQNFKKMQKRRIVVNFGITYETPQPLVAAVPQLVAEIFANIEGADLDRAHFTTFGDSALMYEVVYFVQSADYTDYLNAQQRFNLTLMQVFTEKGISFAYPTQTVYQHALPAR